jgi:hypothetical protein
MFKWFIITSCQWHSNVMRNADDALIIAVLNFVPVFKLLYFLRFFLYHLRTSVHWCNQMKPQEEVYTEANAVDCTKKKVPIHMTHCREDRNRAVLFDEFGPPEHPNRTTIQEGIVHVNCLISLVYYITGLLHNNIGLIG